MNEGEGNFRGMSSLSRYSDCKNDGECKKIHLVTFITIIALHRKSEKKTFLGVKNVALFRIEKKSSC